MNPHMDVGAYLLGALDDDEMARFEEHLAECDLCGDELDQLGGVVPVLAELRIDGTDGAGLAGPPSGDALLDRLLAQVTGARRSRRRRLAVAVAAAAVLVVGGPVIAVLSVQNGGSGSPSAEAGGFGTQQHTGSDPATGVSAVVGVTDKGWGSMIDLRLTGVRGPLTCRLLVYALDGDQQTVATWSVPADGYGTDTQPTPLTVHGAAGLHPGDITHFEIRTERGDLLVSVPA
ncbi:zf-HC2 domain-containing protein [Streptomyces sp. NPDC021020]|uniref:zf-HC2 domain-containing protein n=1 Tax=Streptomyces sp. NPDC021020 TaxID=3365109 RepID=UPI0037B8D385